MTFGKIKFNHIWKLRFQRYTVETGCTAYVHKKVVFSLQSMTPHISNYMYRVHVKVDFSLQS